MTDGRLLEIKNAAMDRGIELTYSLGLDKKYDISSNDEAVRNGGIEYLTNIMKQVSKMDGKIISDVSYAGWGIPDATEFCKEELRDNSVKSMKVLSKIAEELDITYGVEAVNRFEGVVINTSKDALEYVEMVDSEKVGILLDAYHMNIEENSFRDAILTAGDKLVGLHTGENNRSVPGKGHINWDEIFKALADIGFKGRIVSEPFVVRGGEVGRDICVWNNLVKDTTEESLDKEALDLLNFEKMMLNKYGM